MLSLSLPIIPKSIFWTHHKNFPSFSSRNFFFLSPFFQIFFFHKFIIEFKQDFLLFPKYIRTEKKYLYKLISFLRFFNYFIFFYVLNSAHRKKFSLVPVSLWHTPRDYDEERIEWKKVLKTSSFGRIGMMITSWKQCATYTIDILAQAKFFPIGFQTLCFRLNPSNGGAE